MEVSGDAHQPYKRALFHFRRIALLLATVTVLGGIGWLAYQFFSPYRISVTVDDPKAGESWPTIHVSGTLRVNRILGVEVADADTNHKLAEYRFLESYQTAVLKDGSLPKGVLRDFPDSSTQLVVPPSGRLKVTVYYQYDSIIPPAPRGERVSSVHTVKVPDGAR